MAVYQSFKDTRGGGNSFGGQGQQFTVAPMADPDIAAQGRVQQQLQQNQIDAQQRLQDQQLGWQKDRFNTVYGALQNQMAAFGNSLSSVGGASGQGPPIGGGQIWGQQDIQQNLNANRAQIDSGAATQNQNMNGQLAGRGFGSNSPLAAALENQTNMGAMGQKADYTRQFLPQARQQNATFGLEAGKAREQQFASRQNEDIERRRTVASQQSSLLNALSGLV